MDNFDAVTIELTRNNGKLSFNFKMFEANVKSSKTLKTFIGDPNTTTGRTSDSPAVFARLFSTHSKVALWKKMKIVKKAPKFNQKYFKLYKTYHPKGPNPDIHFSSKGGIW